jgi:hypothetical protein
MAIFRVAGRELVDHLPPIRMSPEVWVSSPAIILSSVVLPHPDGPRRTRNSPSRIARSTPSTAVCPVNSLRSALVSTVAIGQSRTAELDELPLAHFSQIFLYLSSASLTAGLGLSAPVAAWANMVFSTPVL